jgi:hypothetical protein
MVSLRNRRLLSELLESASGRYEELLPGTRR